MKIRPLLAAILGCAALACSAPDTRPPQKAIGPGPIMIGPSRECVRTFDPNTGAEYPGDCLAPPSAECGRMRCGDDGKCHLDAYPLGATCDAGTCDGLGACD